MTRRMSCSMTTSAVRRRVKTVTRRHTRTWANLKVGDRLILVEKAMGLKRGERQVVLAEVEITDVRLEPLVAIIDEPDGTTKEGFPDLTPIEFVTLWRHSHDFGGHMTPEQILGIWCRRIEWRYVT